MRELRRASRTVDIRVARVLTGWAALSRDGRRATAVRPVQRMFPQQPLCFAILDEQVAREDFAVADELGEAGEGSKRKSAVCTSQRHESVTHCMRVWRTRFSMGGIAIRTRSRVAERKGVKMARCLARRRSAWSFSLADLISTSRPLIRDCSVRQISFKFRELRQRIRRLTLSKSARAVIG